MVTSVLQSLPRPVEISEKISPTAEKCSFLSDEYFRDFMEFLHHTRFPDTKNEEYRFFPIESFLRKCFTDKNKNFQKIDISIHNLPNNPDAYNIYLINGTPFEISNIINPYIQLFTFPDFASDKSLLSLRFIKDKPDVFEIIPLLYPSKGLGIHFLQSPDKPVCIWNIFTPATEGLTITNILTIIEPKVQAEIQEFFVSENPSSAHSFHLHFHEKQITPLSNLKHTMIQNLDEHNYIHSVSYNHLMEHSSCIQSVFSLNGGMIRNNHHVYLHEPNANGKMLGLTIGKNKNIIDHHTLIRHLSPNAVSHEYYKGIAHDASSIIFNGKITVDYDAQKTNSYQNSKFLLMGSQATIQAKPQLEIFANDVKCSHGSATGKPDEMALFYMQSRGISRKKAMEIWAQGFLSELVQSIDHEFVKNYVEQRLFQ